MHLTPPARVILVCSTFPMLRSVPFTVSLVPPACGPRDGTTPTTCGETTRNWTSDVPDREDMDTWMTLDPMVPPPVITHLIRRPGMKLSRSVGAQGTPFLSVPIVMLSALKSSKVTPNSLPVMVMVVPPSGGPELGLMPVTIGFEHCEPSVWRVPWQSAVKEQMWVIPFDLSHHPHLNPLSKLAPRHEEQPSAKFGQL